MSKSLICITTCNRLDEVKKYIWDYIQFCNSNSKFDFLLSLDGQNPEYIEFCNQFEIPLIYSEANEGVGLSKNRVLKQFPNYDYYFFIEDDVELIDSIVFQNHINASELKNYPHLTLTFPRNIISSEQGNEFNFTLAQFGSAHVNFFKGEALKKVGGWNDTFAKYKRFGHTEHSYRFVHNNLQPAAFIVLQDELKHMFIHNPPHVTNHSIETNNNQLISEEQELIDKQIKTYPLTTLEAFHFNGNTLNYNKKVADFLSTNKRRYPLTRGKERRKSLAEHYFMKMLIKKSLFTKIRYFILSIVNNPINVPFKHWVKQKLHLA
jgi:hypothetical protein